VDESLINYLPVQDAYLTNEKIVLGNFLIFLILFIVPILIHVVAKIPNILLKVRGNTGLDLFILLVLGIICAVFINFYVYQAKTYQIANINIVLVILTVFILMQLFFSYFIVFVVLGIVRKKQIENLEEILTHDIQTEPKQRKSIFAFLYRNRLSNDQTLGDISTQKSKIKINVRYNFPKLFSNLNKKTHAQDLKPE
jgi:hypothetical protein